MSTSLIPKGLPEDEPWGIGTEGTAMLFYLRQRTRAVGSLAVLVVSFAPTCVRGQLNGPAPGTRVVIKPGAVLKVDTRVVDTGKVHRFYEVGRSNGDWLWLTSGAIGGWVKAADVLPLDRAIAFYSAAIKNDPNAAWAYLRRGLVRHSQRDFDGAITDYSKVIRLYPKSVAALANRGIARQAKGDLNKAIADYDEAIRQGMNTAQAYNNRGHAWELKKDYDRAIADYTKAIELSPEYLFSRLNRGNAWKAKGDFAKAVADYEAATRIDPRSPWGYALQAEILATRPGANKEDGRKAVELATKATDLGGARNAYLCEVRAAAHAAAGELERAAEWQTMAREAASNTSSGDSLAQPDRPRRPYDRAPIGSFSIPSVWSLIRSASSGENASVVSNLGGNALSSASRPDTSYGTNYVLLPNVGSTTVLPQYGGTNIGYTTTSPTYYTGNSTSPYYRPGVANGHPTGFSPVNPVNPTYYGANISGKSLVSPNYNSNPIGRSFYGANYSGTASFNPGNPAGFTPINPGGSSFYGADYSGTMNFTPGSIPSTGP